MSRPRTYADLLRAIAIATAERDTHALYVAREAAQEWLIGQDEAQAIDALIEATIDLIEEADA